MSYPRNIEDAEIHVLGFYVDLDSARLHETLQTLRRKRIARCEEILTRLRMLSIDIPLSYVLGLGKKGFIGRSQIFRAMVELGFARPERSYGDFQRYLGKTGFAYVEHQGFSPEGAVEFIRACSGVPILAHPGTQIPVSFIKHLIDLGLEGIEAYHPSHSNKTCRKWLRFAKRHDLIVTGGSDFHRANPDGSVDLGRMTIPDNVAMELIKRWLQLVPDTCIRHFEGNT